VAAKLQSGAVLSALAAVALMIGIAGSAHAQLRVQSELAQVDRTFICPESLPSDEARLDAAKLFVEQVAAIEPHLTIGELIGYRLTLLRKHGCTQTLRYIGELSGSGSPSPLFAGAATPDLIVARKFYDDLAAGDGEQASALVIPEKRQSGPLSAGELTRFYAQMRVPLQLHSLELVPDGSVGVRYSYVAAGGHRCVGSANLYMTTRDGRRLIGRIDAHHGC
jgi:hypothetical protein